MRTVLGRGYGCEVLMLKSNNAHKQMICANLRGLLVTGFLTLMGKNIKTHDDPNDTMLRSTPTGYLRAEKQLRNGKYIQS